MFLYLFKWSLDKFVIIDILVLIFFTVSSWKELNSITWKLYRFFVIIELQRGSPMLPPTNVLILLFFKISPISLVVVDFPLVPVTAIIFWFLIFEKYKFESLFNLDLFLIIWNFFCLSDIPGVTYIFSNLFRSFLLGFKKRDLLIFFF